jgi:3-hydroxybutyryl-CoA dehydrogenase
VTEAVADPREWPARVAVIGAGTMGIGIAHVLAGAGIDTTLADVDAAAAAAGHARALESMSRLEEIGCAEPGAAARVDAHLSHSRSAEAAVVGAQLIIEAVVERAEVKREVYESIGAMAPPPAVIATNTSSIPIEELASGVASAERFVGVHWFVPPLLVPCVEVIPCRSTDAQVVANIVTLLESLNKIPVVVGDSPGFVANRVQFALFREATRIVEEGIATAEQVDEIVRSSFGFRLPFFGPFTIADMAGLDVYADIFATLEPGLGESFSAPALLSEQVAAGNLGVKSGRGFRDIPAERSQDLIDRRDRAYAALARIRRELEE